ncbi:MAG: peroxidase family protein [Verrucomicrobiota bacterium]
MKKETTATLAALLFSAATLMAERPDQRPRHPDQPARQGSGPGDQDGRDQNDPRSEPTRFPMEFRTIDGSGNNLGHALWGSADIELIRKTATDYADGANEPSGGDRPNPRAISNACSQQNDDRPNAMGVSDFLWQWGQFLDHDVGLTGVIDPHEAFDIEVPAGDPWFDPFNTGAVIIPLERSFYNVVDGVRQQVNEITAFIDASNVYGSDETLATGLRTMDGTGKMKTSAGDLLPFNLEGLPNAPSDAPGFFIAGDFRANEQAGLTAMHTLFVREHNYWADVFRTAMPNLSGEEVYQYARAVVAAEMQVITYREFLPALLGRDAMRPYRGYRPEVNPGLANVFSTAAYRFGHSMLSSTLLRLDAEGNEIAEGHIELADAFFNPLNITGIGIEPYLRGLAAQRAQTIDLLLVDDVRNFLFGPPGAGGFDLASLNIQRGRDHGLPNFNEVRRAYGLRPVRSFNELTGDPEMRERLNSVYEHPNEVDPWVGGLAEEPRRGALVGETNFRIIRDQFERLRDGDRFWYESYLPDWMKRMVEQQTLSRIIQRNTDIGRELPRDVFRVVRNPNG